MEIDTLAGWPLEDPRVVHVSAGSGMAEDPSWVADTAALFELVHWHGGGRGATVAGVRALVRALMAAGKPLVVTVPGGVPGANPPELGDGRRTPADALSVLIPAAAAVIAPDGGAAAAVWRAWGRSCLVVSEDEQDDTAVTTLYRAVVAERPFAVDIPPRPAPRPTGVPPLAGDRS